MAVARRILNARFGKRATELGSFEVWIVAESSGPARLLEHSPPDFAAPKLFERTVFECRDGNVDSACAKRTVIIGASFAHSRNQLRVVSRIKALAIALVVTRPSFAVDTWLASERVDAHAGVVAKGG
jgi:hypothetical protein